MGQTQNGITFSSEKNKTLSFVIQTQKEKYHVISHNGQSKRLIPQNLRVELWLIERFRAQGGKGA